MWPFNKTKPMTQKMSRNQISYSQLDITEKFGDDAQLKPEDWIPTMPLNNLTSRGQASGLPPIDASDEEVYTVAEKMSQKCNLLY
jgi:hypothetical protein